MPLVADYARRPVSVRTAFRRWPKIRGRRALMLRRGVRQKTAVFCADSGFLRGKWLIYISFFLLRDMAWLGPGRRQVRQSTASQQSVCAPVEAGDGACAWRFAQSLEA
ncbi:MAG: FIG00461353: hypothetical protein [uncultured Paraburkholderia sp.]|nr:MAG: FIG00461353: hypothetical protein [uncultured Paraburkholderia sp.]